MPILLCILFLGSIIAFCDIIPFDTKFSSLNTGIGIDGAIIDSSGTMSGTLTFPLIGGMIASEGFGIALAVALG